MINLSLRIPQSGHIFSVELWYVCMVRQLYHDTACVKYLSLSNILFQSVKLVFILFDTKVNACVAGDLQNWQSVQDNQHFGSGWSRGTMLIKIASFVHPFLRRLRIEVPVVRNGIACPHTFNLCRTAKCVRSLSWSLRSPLNSHWKDWNLRSMFNHSSKQTH